MKKTIIITLAVAALLPLASCGLYKKYERPQESAIINQLYEAEKVAQDSTLLGNLGWRQVFTDPILRAYIDTALVNNKDLKNTKLNIDIAQAQLQGAKLSYFPSVAFTPNGGAASYGGSHMNWSYTLPLAASWEIDAFAKILNRKRGAQMGVEQAEAYAAAVRSQIIGAVANTYYALASLNMQLEVTRQTVKIWEEQVKSMELMKEAGRVNEAAVVQTRATYYSIQASVPDLESAIRTAENTMALLLNEFPRNYPTTMDMTLSVPMQMSEGIPMSYLAVRPDVAAAERSFAVAYYATNSARAAFYPSLNISAQGGFTNAVGAMITNPGKWFIQLAGSLTAPIFSRGQNIANLKVAKAQQQQALNNFEYTVLNAAAEVSDAMAEYTASTKKEVFLSQQIDQLEKSVDYTNQLLILGQSTYLEVLTARQGLLSAQLSEISCWHSRATALVNLYQSLGGGR